MCVTKSWKCGIRRTRARVVTLEKELGAKHT
jgi:hypothetical protein